MTGQPEHVIVDLVPDAHGDLVEVGHLAGSVTLCVQGDSGLAILDEAGDERFGRAYLEASRAAAAHRAAAIAATAAEKAGDR